MYFLLHRCKMKMCNLRINKWCFIVIWETHHSSVTNIHLVNPSPYHDCSIRRCWHEQGHSHMHTPTTLNGHPPSPIWNSSLSAWLVCLVQGGKRKKWGVLNQVMQHEQIRRRRRRRKNRRKTVSRPLNHRQHHPIHLWLKKDWRACFTLTWQENQSQHLVGRTNADWQHKCKVLV